MLTFGNEFEIMQTLILIVKTAQIMNKVMEVSISLGRHIFVLQKAKLNIYHLDNMSINICIQRIYQSYNICIINECIKQTMCMSDFISMFVEMST
jgi:hypothetical protein